MSPLSPITPGEEAVIAQPRRLSWPVDPLLTLAVIGLGICSVVTLGAVTRGLVPGSPHYYVDRQVIYLVVGVIFMLVLSRVDYAHLRKLKNVIYGALMLSILAVLGLGSSAKGATRAISLPFFSFQASELGKVLLILALSAFVVDRSRRLRERDTTARVMIVALIPAIFVIAQPDLGSGMVYVVIALTLLFVAGTSLRHMTALVALIIVSVTLVLVAAPAVGVHPYRHGVGLDPGGHVGIGPGLAVQFLAVGAPLGVDIHQHRPAGGLGLGQGPVQVLLQPGSRLGRWG